MKTRTLLFLILNLLPSSIIHSQWIQTNGPYIGKVQHIVSYKNLLYAQSWAGLHKSSDNGDTWKTVTWNQDVFTGVTAQIVKDDTLFLCTNHWQSDSLKIFKFTNENSTLIKSDSGLPLIGRTDFILESDGAFFIGVENKGIYKSVNNGKYWSKADSGLSAAYYRCIHKFAGSIYLVTNNGLYKSDNNGESWRITNANRDGYSITSLGVKLFFGTEDTIYSSADSGKNWEVSTYFNDVNSMFTNKSSIYATSYGKGIILTIDTGRTWKSINSTIDGAKYISAFSDTVFVASRVGVYRTIDNFNNFDKLPLNASLIRNLAIAYNNMFTVSQMREGLFRSNDNGTIWQTVDSLPKGEINSVHSKNDTLYLFSTYGLYQSTDTGDTWEKIDSIGLNNSVYEFTACAGVLYAKTYSGVYLSKNNGKTWDKSLHDSLMNKVEGLYAKNNTLYVILNDRVLFTVDSGKNWTTLCHVSNDTSITSLFISSNKFFLGTNKALLESSDNGHFWIASSLHKGVYQIIGLGDTIIVTAYSENGNILSSDGHYLSTNQGLSWIDINSGLRIGEVMNDCIVKDGYIYGIGFCSGVWKYQLNYVKSEFNALTTKQNELYVFPNPFNPITNISYYLKHPGIVDINVYNMNGQCIKKIEKGWRNSGINKISWNANGIASGSYVLRILFKNDISEKIITVIK